MGVLALRGLAPDARDRHGEGGPDFGTVHGRRPVSANNTGREMANIVGRELDRLADEIRALPDDEALWRRRGQQGNAPGTLALHLVGNLSHYIGANLGRTGYVRDRPAEFEDRTASRQEILDRIAVCRETVTPVLDRLTDEELGEVYPGDTPVHMEGITSRGYLIHTIWHLGWHLGQMYYQRLGEQPST